LADVANLGPQETEAAIAAANAAWPAWRAKTVKERSAILRKWYDLLMANQDDLARLMTAEQGKPLPEAQGEVATAPASSNGSPSRPSASTVKPCPPSTTTSGFWCCNSLLACAQPSRRGTSPWP